METGWPERGDDNLGWDKLGQSKESLPYMIYINYNYLVSRSTLMISPVRRLHLYSITFLPHPCLNIHQIHTLHTAVLLT